jgi:hypothetical protein
MDHSVAHPHPGPLNAVRTRNETNAIITPFEKIRSQPSSRLTLTAAVTVTDGKLSTQTEAKAKEKS